MPDDIEETQEPEEVQNQEEIDEEAAFDEATGEKPPVKADKTKKADESGSPEQGEETPTDKGEGPEASEQEPEAEKPEKSAREIADERANKLLGEAEPQEPSVAPPQEEKPVQQPPVIPPPPVSSSMTKEMVARYLGAIPDEDLPQGEMIIGDQTVNLREYKEIYPEEYAAMMVLAGTVARKMVDEALGNAKYAGTDDIQRIHQEYQQEIQDLRFWQQVSVKHPDALAVAKDKGFTGWLEKQSKGIRALAMSIDPEDGISVLDLYKEEQAKARVAEHDNKDRDRKKAKDALHTGTLRAGTQTKRGDDDADADDEQSGFNLYFEKKKRQGY